MAGGDGTIDAIAGALVGKKATLGIVPSGTRNNVARSLGIPGKIEEALALLRNGRRLWIDAGHVRRHVTQNYIFGTMGALVKAITAFLTELANSPEVIRSIIA